jgi:SagB-type dehydrogenase family enzyme
VYERTSIKYRERTERYVHIEVGHAAQNVFLQVEALGLGTVVIGAFYDDEIRKVMNMPGKEAPLYIMPVGREKSLR